MNEKDIQGFFFLSLTKLFLVKKTIMCEGSENKRIISLKKFFEIKKF